MRCTCFRPRANAEESYPAIQLSSYPAIQLSSYPAIQLSKQGRLLAGVCNGDNFHRLALDPVMDPVGKAGHDKGAGGTVLPSCADHGEVREYLDALTNAQDHPQGGVQAGVHRDMRLDFPQAALRPWG